MNKIAFLVEIVDNIEQAGDLITALATYDEVFVSFGSLEDKETMTQVFTKNPNVHLLDENLKVIQGTLSVSRTYMILLKAAIECGNFCAYIPLNEYSLPIVNREEIFSFINAHPNTDVNYAICEDDLPGFRRLMRTFVIGTKGVIKGVESASSTFLKIGKFIYVLGIRKKNIAEKLYCGQVWSIMCHKTAKMLVDNLYECSENYYLSWFSEDSYFSTFIRKYSKKVLNKKVCNEGEKEFGNLSLDLDSDEIVQKGDWFFVNRAIKENYPKVYKSYLKKY